MTIVKACMLNRTARVLSSLAAFSFLLVSPLAAQKAKPKPGAARVAQVSNRYALILSGPSVVDRFPTRNGYQSSEARSYRADVERRQESLKTQLRARNFDVIG